jgi:hypothetical protein
MRMIKGGRRVAYTRRREIHKAFWLRNLKKEENIEDIVANEK